jgi:hypothetical protein
LALPLPSSPPQAAAARGASSTIVKIFLVMFSSVLVLPGRRPGQLGVKLNW